MIVIDSNQILSMPPGSPSWSLLRVVGERTGHSLAISEVSLWEVLSSARRRLEDDIAAFERAWNKLAGRLESYAPENSALPFTLNHIGFGPDAGDPEKAVRAYEAQLRQRFRVLRTPESVASEALRREAWREPPCKDNGEGGRDAAIWLTAAAAAEADVDPEGRKLPLLLVSNDGGFTDPRNKGQLHPALANDLPEGVCARLCRSLPEVFAEISQPADAADLLPMMNSADIIDALITAILDSKFPGKPEVHEAGSADGNRRIFTMGEILRATRASFKGFQAAPAKCTSDGETWICASGTWVFPRPHDSDTDLAWAFRGISEYNQHGLEATATLFWAFTAGESSSHVQVIDASLNGDLAPGLIVARDGSSVMVNWAMQQAPGYWQEII
ncbi:PIN domain-containing protein [Streptomyces fumanus]|uniref:PIN domain-containing protein n=1 Tax=Streptomyces fumanus TaxID=67302 RepID=UPI00167CBD7D|nr:PIN domain-containing protein [Streptomyces fumanus]